MKWEHRVSKKKAVSALLSALLLRSALPPLTSFTTERCSTPFLANKTQ